MTPCQAALDFLLFIFCCRASKHGASTITLPLQDVAAASAVIDSLIAIDCSGDSIPETQQSNKRILWKKRKSLNVIIPHPSSYLGDATPFSNLVFEEFAVEVTAAIQFCIGSTRKIPATLDKRFNAALRAEGGRVLQETVRDILDSVYKCAFSGKDLKGNLLVYEELIPFMVGDAWLMDSVFLYIEREWKGTCVLMILKQNHRLYRNYHNAIVGVVVHNEAIGSAKLLGDALDALRGVIQTQAVRGILYQFHKKSNSYLEEDINTQCENLDDVKSVFDQSEYGFTSLHL